MNVDQEIIKFLDSLDESKQAEMNELHQFFIASYPKEKRWFSDGLDQQQKVVANPTIGYGEFVIKYKNGSTRDFFRIGLSANKSGISIQLIPIKDNLWLTETYGDTIGKATLSSYCIQFKSLKNIHFETLKQAIQYTFNL